MRLVCLLLLATLGLTACGGSDSAELDPTAALDQAKQTLLNTSGVSFTLATDGIPDGESGLLTATGVINNSPAFKGDFTIPLGGMTPSIQVIAVDGVVYAQIPLTPGWQEVNPGDFNVPDPATLIDAEAGIPSLLSSTTDVTAGEQSRGGADNKEVLTVYSGTLPGDAVKKIISGATGDFSVDYTISDSGELSTAVITGDFYGTGEETTYTATISDYGSDPQISAP